MTPLPAGPVFEFGPFRFESGNHLLLRGSEIIQLAPKAIDTLRVLLERRGSVVNKEELIDRLWPDTSVESANLSQNIYLLRRALGEGSHDQTYIETIPKRGYRFVATVTIKEASDVPVELDTTTRPPNLAVDAPLGEEAVEGKDTGYGPGSQARRPSRTTLAAVLVVIVAILVVIFTRMSRRPIPSGTNAALRSLVVLPFKPIGIEPRDEVLELGMADTLITKLGGIRQIIVRPTSAVRRYGGVEQDPLAAGREQRADLVLEGSVQRIRDRIRVTVRLLNVHDGTALMGEALDEPAADVFAAQDSIAQHVIQSLAVRISDDERTRMSRRYAADPVAFQLYLKGRYFWDKRTPEGFQKAVRSFEDAIEREPQNPLPYVGLADAYIALPFDTDAPPAEALRHAMTSATRALEIDDTLAEAHAALGFVRQTYEWDWRSAEREFKRALELSPNSATAHQRYANYLTVMGHHPLAIAETERALELDPISLGMNGLAGRQYYFAREYDRSLEQCRTTLDLDANFWIAHFFAGKDYLQKRMYGEALRELRLAGDITSEVLATTGYVHAVSKNVGEARTILDQLRRRRSQAYVPPSHLARIHAALGENDQAFAWLDKAYEERDVWLIWLTAEPMWDSLQSDPRFGDLLRRLRLPRSASHRM